MSLRDTVMRSAAMTRGAFFAVFACLAAAPGFVVAQANLDISSPSITSVQSSMRARHVQLAPHYASGAVGLTRDGDVALRDANAVPLAQRQAVTALVAAENQDRAALYREIARANGHPEWEADVRSTFAQRWVSKAQAGWYYQTAAGAWVRR